MGNHDGYLELESQLANRGAFPRELWEAGFGNDLQQIEAICMDLQTDCCWKNPFFIPEDPLETVFLGNGDYESYFTILCSVEKHYGIKLADEEVEAMTLRNVTFGEFFDFLSRNRNRNHPE